VKHRSKWQGLWIGVFGVALTLAPMSAAGAHTNHRGRHHSSGSVKGSNPGAAMCQDVKNEQSDSSSVGQAIEKAIESGNFAGAKQAMLNAYDADLGNVQKALGVIKSAPANVQAAFRNLLTFVRQIRTDIQNASSEQGLITSFETLGKNAQLESDGATIANWYASVCGGPLVTTPTPAVP
jgi:hypothetical protein